MLAKTLDQEKLRHTSAHVLAQAILQIFPNAKLGIGPVTKSGFAQEFFLEEDKLNSIKFDRSLLKKIEQEMQKIIESELPLDQILLEKEEAINVLLQRGQIFKSELLQQIDTEEVSFYRTGTEFTDLCRGPHLIDTGKIGAIKLTKILFTNWLSDPNRPKMIRIEGLAFSNRNELQKFEADLEKIKENNHKIIAPKLLIIKENKQGTNSFTLPPQGVKLKRNIIEYFLQKLDYINIKEYEVSNLWDRITYANNQFSQATAKTDDIDVLEDLIHTNETKLQHLQILTEEINNPNINLDTGLGIASVSQIIKPKSFVDGKQSLKRMDCTSGINVSYLSNEKSLKSNLRRFIQFIYTSHRELLKANLFARVTGEKTEFLDDLVEQIIDMNINVNLIETKESPSISIFHTDPLEKEYELSRISFDEILDAKLAKDNLKYIFFAPVLDVYEYIAIVLEANAGNLPLIIAPYQLAIIPETKNQDNYCKSISTIMQNKGLRAFIDTSERSFTKKINSGKELRYPYILSAGEQEMNNNVMYVRPGIGEDLGLMSIEEFLQKVIS